MRTHEYVIQVEASREEKVVEPTAYMTTFSSPDWTNQIGASIDLMKFHPKPPSLTSDGRIKYLVRTP